MAARLLPVGFDGAVLANMLLKRTHIAAFSATLHDELMRPALIPLAFSAATCVLIKAINGEITTASAPPAA